MAIDPTALADEQTQRAALAAQGAPTEFARGPEQAVQVAGPAAEGLFELFRRMAPSVTETRPSGQPARPPEPQTMGIVEQPGALSLRGAAAEAAPEVLSDEGLARFEAMQYTAPTPQQFAAPAGPQAPNDVLQSATEALDEQATEAVQQAEDLRTGAQRALTAEDRGFGPESGVAPEAVTDEVLAQLSAEELNIKSLADGGDFNFDLLTTPDSVKATITAVGEVLADPQAAVTRGIRTNEVTTAEAAKLVADEIGMSRTLLSRRIGDGALNAEQMVAARELLVRSATRITDLAELIKGGTASAADRLAFRRQLAIHAGIQMQLKGAQTEAARALQSFRIPVSGELDAAKLNAEAQRIMQEGGLDESTNALAGRLLNLSNRPESERLAAINKVVNRGFGARTKAAVHEAFLTGLLSMPTTQVKNIVGTASLMLYQIPAEMFAGAYGAALRGTLYRTTSPYVPFRPKEPLSEDQVYMQDAFFRMRGWVDSFGDALHAAAIAYRTETPSSMATKLDVETFEPGIVAPPSLQGNIFGRAINEFGIRARIPFRLLLAGDEFFKTISSRGELYTAVNRRYQMSLRMGNTHEQAMDDAGMVLLDPRAVREDLDLKARYDTLTSDLGLFGKAVGAIQRNAVGRFLVPFSTAPTNEMIRTSEFSALGIANPTVLRNLAGLNGPRAQQLTLGRLSVGAATMAVVYQYAADGHITGAIPSDEKLRNALPPGWQPYSVVSRGEGFPIDEDGDPLPLYDIYGRPNGPLTYVSFAGYGPVTSVIGITADATQRMTRIRDPERRGNWVAAGLAATADYYMELPMLAGIADVISAVKYVVAGKSTSAVDSFLRGPAQAATPLGVPSPISAVQRGIFRVLDPTRVEARGDLEYYTLDEVEAGAASGDRTFLLPDGQVNYNMVGLSKGDEATSVSRLFAALNAYQTQDSMFRNERDENAIMYDTLGSAIGAEDISIANRPGLAIWNAISGIRIVPGQELTPVEDELMRLAAQTNNWPLTNRESMNGMRLSPGAQSDLTNIAKNEVTFGVEEVTEDVTIDFSGADFRTALDRAINMTVYARFSDKDKALFLRAIENMYYERAFELLLARPEYANLATAYQDRQRLQEQGVR
jgi:hypothetical protein